MSNFQLGQNLVITNVNADYWNSLSPNTLDSVRSWATNNFDGKIIIPQGEWDETVFNSFKNANANYLQAFLWDDDASGFLDISSVVWAEWVEECPYFSILIIDSDHVSNMNSTFSGYTWYNDPEVWSSLTGSINKLFRFPRATNFTLENNVIDNEGLLALNRDTNQLSFVDSTWSPVNGVIDPSTSSAFSSLSTQAADPESFGLVELSTSVPSTESAGPIKVVFMTHYNPPAYIFSFIDAVRALNIQLAVQDPDDVYFTESTFSHIQITSGDHNSSVPGWYTNGTPIVYNGAPNSTQIDLKEGHPGDKKYDVVLWCGNAGANDGSTYPNTASIINNIVQNKTGLILMMYAVAQWGFSNFVMPDHVIDDGPNESMWISNLAAVTTNRNFNWYTDTTGGEDSFFKGLSGPSAVQYYYQGVIATTLGLWAGPAFQGTDLRYSGSYPVQGDPLYQNTNLLNYIEYMSGMRRADINGYPSGDMYQNPNWVRLVLNTLYWASGRLSSPTD